MSTSYRITMNDIPTRAPGPTFTAQDARRIDVLEAQVLELHRQLRDLRGEHIQRTTELMVLVDRGMDRADIVDQRLKDLSRVCDTVIKGMTDIEGRIHDNELDIARVGDRCANRHLIDLGTGQPVPAPPEKKGLFVKGGWVRVFRDRSIGYNIWDTAEEARECGSPAFFAIVRIPDIYKGEGLE